MKSREQLERSVECLLLLLFAGLIAGCEQTAEESSGRGAWQGGTSSGVPVVAEPVRFEAERIRIEAVGTARARRSVELYPEAAGEVVAVNFTPGQRVAEGDVLLELDARDERLALELADVRLDEARRLLERYEASQGRGEATVAATVVDTARSAVEAARIERDRARVALDKRTVRAPFAGVVGLTEVDPGDRIDPTTLIANMDDRGALLVRFPVPEAFAGRLSPGDPIEIETWTVGRRSALGAIVDVDSRIDPTSRAFNARAEVENPDDSLRPGMSFRVGLDLVGDRWPSVPEVSLLWGADGPYVWVVDEGRARRVDVAVVQRKQGRVLVDGDIAPGTEIVAEGVQRMRANLPLRTLDAEMLARDARRALAPPEQVERAQGQ
ncbi:MAG: efflux RND transporter periplasmic adaptor subunit [Pseudomonadales bacterium]|nr:efflux RND transporter periplasmic adaptor subunit [Pseudomonadales bacterium]